MESVRRALSILRCFSIERPTLGIADIARELQLHKSTVHRLIHTLEREGFVHAVDGSQFVLGWRLFELGEAVRGREPAREVILESLTSLVEATGETAHLAVFDAGDVLYIEKVEATRSLRMPSAVGKRVPAHCTALGKIFLSNLSDDQLLQALTRRRLTAFTANTITDVRRLTDELARVRASGHAVDREEIEEGLMCVAGPVTDDLGTLCAAVSISGPASRIAPRLDAHVRNVTAICDQLTLRLGPRSRELLAGTLGESRW